jgi:hypothetical protein
MQPRCTVLELFSTSIGFENDRFQQWLTEPALRRNLQRQTSTTDETEADRSSQDYWGVLASSLEYRSTESSPKFRPNLPLCLALEHFFADRVTPVVGTLTLGFSTEMQLHLPRGFDPHPL